MSDTDPNTAESATQLLTQRSKEAEAAMPSVEDFFRLVAHRVRARLVNRSSVDIPVRVAGVDVTCECGAATGLFWFLRRGHDDGPWLIGLWVSRAVCSAYVPLRKTTL